MQREAIFRALPLAKLPRREGGESIGGDMMRDTQADVPLAETLGATCVQRLDGSRDSAIHTKYRISLRSSSMREPRYPLPRVIVVKIEMARPFPTTH